MEQIVLSNGVSMPIMGIGTNWMSHKELKTIVAAGLKAGFRAIDTARDYGNEHIVGDVISELCNELCIKRSEIFITTKIGNTQQIAGNIEKELNISLKNLKSDYIDLWLMHWPYPEYYVKTWNEMQRLYSHSGRIRAIGVANFRIRHFEQLMNNSIGITPMVNQMEYHPLRTVDKEISFMRKNNIAVQAYAPLCRLVDPLKNSIILNELSTKYNKSIGQIILRWHIQQGFVMPIFKSYKAYRFKENINIFDFELDEKEMQSIHSLNIDYKYHIESCNCPGY